MEWIDLGNPRPRAAPAVYTPVRWPQGEVVPLVTPPRRNIGRDFADVVQRRRSCRAFAPVKTDVMLGLIGELLWMAYGAQSVGDRSLGFPISRRPSPSAGAIHPIHVVISVPGRESWHRFDSQAGVVVELPTTVQVEDVRRSLNPVLEAENAALVLFIAEPAMTAAKYEQSASLVWRDAGVLQGVVSLAAEAMGLGCTLLGVTGNPWSQRLLGQPGLHGVGAAFIGMPALMLDQP